MTANHTNEADVPSTTNLSITEEAVAEFAIVSDLTDEEIRAVKECIRGLRAKAEPAKPHQTTK